MDSEASASMQQVHAKLLRLGGKVNGERPEEPLSRTELKIKPPDINTAPKAPVEAVLILGMGPVQPVFIGHGENRRVVTATSRMRNNTIAGLEIAAHDMVEPYGVVVPSGTATADPDVVEDVLKTDLVAIEQVYSTAEADLMQHLFNEGHAKNGQRGSELGLEVIPDRLATETAENFIFLLNLLDKRSREASTTLFTGSIAAITSRYHIARTMELARYLGIGDQVVPLVSQEVLTHFEYKGYKGHLRTKDDEKFDEETRWREQKWIRTIHQKPQYLLPVLAEITDNERLIITLSHLRELYGTTVFDELELRDIDIQNADHLRNVLKKIPRINPIEEEWMKSDHSEVDKVIDQYSEFTRTWLNQKKES